MTNFVTRWAAPPHYLPAYAHAGPVSPAQPSPQQQQQQQLWASPHAHPADLLAQPMWAIAALQAQAAQAAYNELASAYYGGGAHGLHGGYRR